MQQPVTTITINTTVGQAALQYQIQNPRNNTPQGRNPDGQTDTPRIKRTSPIRKRLFSRLETSLSRLGRSLETTTTFLLTEKKNMSRPVTKSKKYSHLVTQSKNSLTS